MSTYATLDQLIKDAADAGKHPLYARPVRAEAERIAKASGRDDMRIIDGRLQALRRAGAIKVDRKSDAGWVVIR